MKKDNSTLDLKVSIRKRALTFLDDPVVLETHAGYGKIWQRCYADLSFGVAMEKDKNRTPYLAKQRPRWAIYECDSTSALEAGAASHFEINLIDIDPYGDPWPTINAFLLSERPRPRRVVVVVNDGLRGRLQIGREADVASVYYMVEKYGSIYEDYLDFCQIMMEEKAEQVGYSLFRWAGYYCGRNHHVTHFLAVLQRSDN
jgi:hypothetical protein